MEARKKIKYLAVSYYGCVVSPYSKDHKTFLSKEILNEARQGAWDSKDSKSEYAGFYGMTRACFANAADNYRGMVTNYKKVMGVEKEDDWQNLMVHKITENFAAASGLKCIAVANPDDENGPKDPLKKCGSGFEGIIKPLEKSQFDSKTSLSHEPVKNDDVPREVLLRNVIAHAIAANPKADIELDYFDHNIEQCNSVRQIPQGLFPVNVKINVNLYNGKKDQIQFLESVEFAPAKFQSKRPSPLQVHSAIGQKQGDYAKLQDLTDRMDTPKDEEFNCCKCM